MAKDFWFKSSKFNVLPREDEETNPGCYGKSLAQWMKMKLTDRGYEPEEIIAEDWGWCLMCQSNPFFLWIGCGSAYEKEIKENPDPDDLIWHCFPISEIPFYMLKQKFLHLIGKLDTQSKLDQLEKDVYEILANEPSVKFYEEP